MAATSHIASMEEPVSFLDLGVSLAKAQRSHQTCSSCGVVQHEPLDANAVCHVCACIRDAQAMIDGMEEVEEEVRHPTSLATILETVEEVEAAQGSRADSPLSCSDNDNPDAWQATVTPSVAGISTADSTDNLPLKQDTEVPKDLLHVLDRQEAVIECLVRRCQALETQAAENEETIVGHEEHRQHRQSANSALQAEVSALKAATDRQPKERGPKASITNASVLEAVEAEFLAQVAPFSCDDPSRERYSKSSSSQACASACSGPPPSSTCQLYHSQ